MADKNPEVRYGAFPPRCAPWTSGARKSPASDSTWRSGLHQVAPDSEPMIHLLSSRRPEIVLFGDKQLLVGPFPHRRSATSLRSPPSATPQVCKVQAVFSVKNGQAEKAVLA